MKPGIMTTEAWGGGGLAVSFLTWAKEAPPVAMICVTVLACCYILARTWLKLRTPQKAPSSP